MNEKRKNKEIKKKRTIGKYQKISNPMIQKKLDSATIDVSLDRLNERLFFMFSFKNFIAF